MKKSLVVLVVLLLCSCPASADGTAWIETTFEDFSDGTFGDGGANLYVSAQGTVQTIHRWDLNDDGCIDLVFANSHRHAEKLDAQIFWGDRADLDARRSSYVPSNGMYFPIAADINGNGHRDLVVPNYQNGTHDRLDSFVYFHQGGKHK